MAKEVAKYRANYQDEVDSAALYRALAEAEEQWQRARVCERLAVVEEDALLTLLTGRSVLFSGIRRVLIGLATAALTYADRLLIETIVGQ